MQTPTEKKWVVKDAPPPEVEQALMVFSPPFRQVLYHRGIHNMDTALAYLDARPPDGCEPLAMLGVEAAVERIRHAIRTDEAIAVYGDYDADGVTATALLTHALRRLGALVRGYIPNRFDEGYGLNIEALDTLKREGTGLVITVDCGVRSLSEAEHAREIGLDLIITDHHSPGPELPPALALINPKQPGDSYPDKDLAGVGLAYKLVCGLFDGVDDPAAGDPHDYLDLVALGTVTDLAPLTGENRHLVREGLTYLRRPFRQGIMSLIGAAQISAEKLSCENIGFQLGPRLNAAGRLETAMNALDLLMATDVTTAGALAQQLNSQNYERQQITRAIQASAEALALDGVADCMLLFAADPDFNPGVIGLAASRLCEQYYRPAIVAHRGETATRGSCRSIPGFHITEALDQCADLLVKHGGHAAAAGFTVLNENLDELVSRLQAIAGEQLAALDLRPTLYADAEARLDELRASDIYQLMKELERMEPTGQHNPAATFVSRGLSVKNSRTVGKDASHLKLTLNAGGAYYDAIAFRLGHLHANLPPRVDVMYRFEKNEYMGRESLQLNVKDVKKSEV